MTSEAKPPIRSVAVAVDKPEPAGEGSTALTRILAQQAAVAQFAQRALAEPRLEILLSEAVTLVGRMLQTELVSLASVEEDGSLRLVAGVGWRPGIVGELRLAAGAGSQSGYTLQTGGPLIVEDLASETRFRVVPELIEHGARSGVSARIGEAQQPFGVLSAFTERRGSFTRDDANFLQAVAGVLAAAIGRLRIESELRASRDELAAIVGTVNDGILVRGPDGRLLYANEPAARMNKYSAPEALVEARPGLAESRFKLYDEHGRQVDTEQLPSRITLRTGRQTPEMLIRVVWNETGEERWQLIQASPVRGPDGSIEKVVVVIRDVTDQRRALQARHFLTDALAALSSVLDRHEVARRLAELCVPHLADYCSVDLLDADGSILPLAVAHVDPAKADLARRLRREKQLSPDADSGPARVIREGRPEFVPAMPGGADAAGQASAELETSLELGLASRLCVPLVARGRPIGALTLARERDGRRLDEHDLSLAEELGARAGIALENARLFAAAEDRRSQLDAVLAAMADAVLVFDASGRLRLTNPAAGQLFAGNPPRTVERLRQLVVVTEASGGQDSRGHSAAEPRPTSAAFSDLDGELQLASSSRWFELRSYRSRRTPADRDESHGPLVVVLRDVTDTRSARAARDAFLGVLSHELRTPITTIYGGSELLARSMDEGQREEVLRDIRVESERLARLVEDLLVMTRVERGGVEIGDEPVLMQRMIPAVARSLQARLPGLQIELAVRENLPAVRGDPTYLEQVLRNLLTNAVRYGDGLEKGVQVTAHDAGKAVEVRVLDSGPGLAEGDVEHLFELFYRSPAARVVPGGAGIGLFVCRRLIEAMGGHTWARVRSEGGAEFGFALPVIETDAS